jgi:hypothetical protein
MLTWKDSIASSPQSKEKPELIDPIKSESSCSTSLRENWQSTDCNNLPSTTKNREEPEL